MEPTKAGSALTATALRGQQLCIANLLPAFAAWKQGINPSYERVKQAIDGRLEGLIGDERVLMKVKEADIGLFAAGYGLLLLFMPCAEEFWLLRHLPRWFPDASDRVLETVAFYCVWLFLWDDAIDGADLIGSALVADEYCQQSVEFVSHSLGLNEPGEVAPKAPTKICESFAEVGRRIAECCGVAERREVFGHLREYMEGCVTEYKWRVSRKVPSVDEFYSWRLRTSSVDVMLDLCRWVPCWV